MSIERVTHVTPDLVEAFARLLPQHSRDSRQPTHEQLAQVVAMAGLTLLIARDDAGQIVGTLTLLVYPTPGHLLSLIEDVVVDRAARGRGAGEALVREALRLAAEAGAEETDLLSNDRREAAIRLYQRVGFHRFETNVFRFRHRSVAAAGGEARN